MAVCTIFEEDEVSLFSNKGFRCGLVLESSEYASSDEEEEDPPFFERVRKGTIRVAWHPDGDEEVVQESKVLLTDRSLMPGDVIRRLIEGQDSQRGYVINTNVKAHVQLLGRSKIICDVNTRDLVPLETWNTDPGTVYLDSWTGRIERIIDSITVRFPDGARCEVSDDDFFTQLANFEDLNEKRERDSEFFTSTYYPSQQLKGDLGNLVSANWLKTTKAHCPGEAKKQEGKEVIITVEKVEAKSIEVHWVCRGYSKLDDPSNKLEPPPRILYSEHIKKLKKLDCFEACSVQIGDKAFYTVKPTDKVLTLSRKGKNTVLHQLLNEDLPAQDVGDLDESNMNARNSTEEYSNENGSGDVDTTQMNGEAAPAELCNIAAPAAAPQEVEHDEDEWEDDDADEGDSDAGSTTSSHSTSSQKKLKKGGALKTKLLKRKKLKGSRHARACGKEPSAGETIAVEVVYTVSSIDVMWQDGTVECQVASTDLFPIHHLDELEFFPGDFVVPADNTDGGTYGVVEKVDHGERTCVVRWMKPYVVGEGTRPTENIMSEELSVYDIKDHQDYKFRPGQAVVRVGGYEEQQQALSTNGDDQAAGQVFKLCCDGILLIQWPDGTRSMCYPQELYLIDDVLSELNDSEFDSDSDSDSTSMGDSDSNASWETENEESMDEDEDEKEKDSEDEFTVEAEKKVELDQLLDTAKSTLKKLEETFAYNVDIGPCAIHCYKEILHINRNCRDLDKMLSTSYFEDSKLSEVISMIRRQLKHEKTAKLTKAVMELFESNCKQSTSSGPGTSGGGVGGCDASVCSETDSGLGKSPSGPAATAAVKGSAGGVVTAADFIGQAVQIVEGVVKSESPPEALQKELAKLDVQFKQLQVQGILGGIPELSPDASATSTSRDAKSNCDTSAAPKPAAAASATDSAASAVQTDESAESAKAKELCKEACYLLRVQIIKVHKDLEKKWQKLKDSGKLHVVGEDETSSDASDAESEATLNQGFANTPADQPIIMSTPAAAPAPAPGGGDATPRQNLALNLTKEEESVEALLKSPMTPQTPADVRAKLEFNEHGFEVIESVPETHKFRKSEHAPSDQKAFLSAIRKEMKLLRTSLPNGIFVKGFEDRMDLFTVMIEGPSNTPYEDGLFFFEVQLPNDYPTTPPVFHYVSFCSDKLNPNLYEDGKVCVSLLGTWTGRGTEIWTGKSSLLQVLISIQGLILVSEPYYNEAGYEKQKGTQQGTENSRMYNEMAILKLVQSMAQMSHNPPEAFKPDVVQHLLVKAPRMIERLQYWLDKASPEREMNGDSSGACAAARPARKVSYPLPDFPLLPVSKGFCLTLQKTLDRFKSVLERMKSAL